MKEHLVFTCSEPPYIAHPSALISFALVDEDGAEFYREVAPWLPELVRREPKRIIRHLQGGEVVKPFDTIGRELHAWLAALAPQKEVVLLGDFYTLDYPHLRGLLAAGFPPNVDPRVWPLSVPTREALAHYSQAIEEAMQRPSYRDGHALDRARATRDAWVEAARAVAEVDASPRRSVQP